MDNEQALIEQGTHGWWMPQGHGGRGHKFAQKLPLFRPWLDAVRKAGYPQRTVVQAGGHVGVYPAALAHYYEEVVTFEPHPDNFRALVANVTARNVNPIRAALAERSDLGRYGLSINQRNSGGHHIRSMAADDEPLLSIALDSIRFAALDAIVLDCEGAEYKVLQGAFTTISKHKPVILLEQRGHVEGKVGGASDEDVRRLLDWHGYDTGAHYHHDLSFWPR